MRTISRTALLAAILATGTLASAPVLAQSKVIATVGSDEITEADLAAAEAEIGEDFRQVPEEQRRLAVLSALIDIKVLAAEAEKADLQDDPTVAGQLDFLRDRTLHNAFFERNGVDAVTDEELKARYDKEIAALEPREEIHARHILLKTKEEAEAVIAELQNGADFAKVAEEKSTGPSGPNGGDLGFFSAGQMVPEFEKAAFALDPGSITSEPVQTQFGWHVIKVEEKREAQPPSFEEVKDRIRQLVLRDEYLQLVKEARDEMPVEYVDPEMKSQVEAIESEIKARAGSAE
ncbi:MAG: peptidylprolyl isomerase [Fulvimarina manganoxydans]|uniref:peptidylprolyl isomerase n=1 Tax=Fulvimarina manganoxydans TaxID=937218 RepID=UPI0023579BE6|nr:peptidylprolyl isomerase [Fulvimarina manganoxydans]MCK5934631.1 peptidylprolyl isomerase [Fulvimarina manganoxydans]